jgi:hypothetical protein
MDVFDISFPCKYEALLLPVGMGLLASDILEDSLDPSFLVDSLLSREFELLYLEAALLFRLLLAEPLEEPLEPLPSSAFSRMMAYLISVISSASSNFTPSSFLKPT